MTTRRLLPRTAQEKCINSTPKPLYVRLGSCNITVNSAWYPASITNIFSWGFKASIASPPQEVCLEPSTVVNNTVVMTTEICSNDTTSNTTVAQCAGRRGGELNITAATAQFNIVPTSELAPDPEWDKFNPSGFQEAANTSIQFQSSFTLDSFQIALAENAQNSSVGQLGLGNNSAVLRRMLEKRLIPANGFGYFPGSQSPINEQYGHLIFGGYDRSSAAAEFITFPMNNTLKGGDRSCVLHVTVDGLTLSRPNQEDVQLLTAGTPMPSCIEPLDNSFRFPENILESFKTETGFSEATSIPSDLFVVEKGLYYPNPFNGTLTFSLQTQQEPMKVTIPSSELAWPVRALDLDGRKVIRNNVTMVNIFHDTAPEGTGVLGKVFLSQLILAVNYDLQNFMLAPAAVGPPGALDLVSFNGTSSVICPSSNSEKWTIAGIVLSIILGLIFIAFCIYVLKKRKEARRRAAESHPVDEIIQVHNSSPGGLVEVSGWPRLDSTASEALTQSHLVRQVTGELSAISARTDPVSGSTIASPDCRRPSSPTFREHSNYRVQTSELPSPDIHDHYVQLHK